MSVFSKKGTPHYKEDLEQLPHAIFVLKDVKTMNIVYVGCSRDLFNSRNSIYRAICGTEKLKEYMNECRETDTLPNVEIIRWFNDRKTALSMRRTIIRQLKPALNTLC